MKKIEDHLTLANAADAIASTVFAAHDVMDAKDLGSLASAITRLRDVSSDLASWHPEYNAETGEIGDPE